MKNIILEEISKIVIPIIQLLGIYIIVFGHLSPGGGFAGGTIFGVSFILLRIVYGKEKTRKKLGYRRLMILMSGALTFYGIIKGYGFITGGSNLHVFNIPLGTPGDILSGGYLLPLNLAVGLIVAITMYFFFSLFYEGEI